MFQGQLVRPIAPLVAQAENELMEMSDTYASTCAVVIPAVGIAAVLEVRALRKRNERKIRRFMREVDGLAQLVNGNVDYRLTGRLRFLEGRVKRIRRRYGCLWGISVIWYFVLGYLAFLEIRALVWLANKSTLSGEALRDPSLAMALAVTTSAALALIIGPYAVVIIATLPGPRERPIRRLSTLRTVIDDRNRRVNEEPEEQLPGID